jgi:hypothetical protein
VGIKISLFSHANARQGGRRIPSQRSLSDLEGGGGHFCQRYQRVFSLIALYERMLPCLHLMVELEVRCVDGMRVVVFKRGCQEPRLSAVHAFYSAHLGWGCEPTCDSITATLSGRQALRLLHHPYWGVPEGILMNFAHLWTDCCKIGSLFLQPQKSPKC